MDFRAAIEARKKQAREELERNKKLISLQHPTSPTSPTLPDAPSITASVRLPGLGQSWREQERSIADVQLHPTTDDGDGGPLQSPVTTIAPEKLIASATSNEYGGLTSARKRRRVDDYTEGGPASRTASVDERRQSDSQGRPSFKRPFAPPKKPSRIIRPAVDGM